MRSVILTAVAAMLSLPAQAQSTRCQTFPDGRIYCDEGSGAVPVPGGGYLTNDGRTRVTPADPFGGVRIEDLRPDEQPRTPCRETDFYGRCVR
jgi:hypothetical protein